MKKVLVTGATGRTGAIIYQKLHQYSEEFTAIGFARSAEKVERLFGRTENFFIGDVRNKASLEAAIATSESVIIATSAIPIMIAPPQPGERPKFIYPDGEMPEQIDYMGQKNQIDAAKAAGVQQIVLIGSMGGTLPNHPLNQMGNGNILIWKRKAEEYLIDSGIKYTIIRAGGLLDEPGSERELLVGKNDLFLRNAASDRPQIPRADLAELAIQALRHPEAINKAFDVMAKPSANATSDFAALFAQTTSGL